MHLQESPWSCSPKCGRACLLFLRWGLAFHDVVLVSASHQHHQTTVPRGGEDHPHPSTKFPPFGYTIVSQNGEVYHMVYLNISDISSGHDPVWFPTIWFIWIGLSGYVFNMVSPLNHTEKTIGLVELRFVAKDVFFCVIYHSVYCKYMYPLVNVYIANWKDPPFSSWENPLFRLGHFQ